MTATTNSANPTNAVGGLFILSLLHGWRAPSRIPPTQSVDCSYSAYCTAGGRRPASHQRSGWSVIPHPTAGLAGRGPNPPNAAGGLFHTQATARLAGAVPNPTIAVGGLFILSLQ